jgi:hypothetical protein
MTQLTLKLSSYVEPPAPGGFSNFTVTTWPTNPFVGEVVRVHIEGRGNHTAISPMMGAQDDLLDIWVQTNVDESGATFEAAPDYDAETAYGRWFGHAYSSAGSKTLTISSWTFSGPVLEQTASITVVDPDSYSWDRILWVDMTGDTTDMPAADGTNIRVLSYAQWIATRSSYNGLDVRVRFRGGTTHVLTGGSDWDSDADLVYIDTFGTGRATIYGNLSSGNAGESFVKTGKAGQRIVVRNLDLDGGYDITSGRFSRGRWVGFTFSLHNNSAISLFKCSATGFEDFLLGSGVSDDDRRYRPAMVDCEAIGNQNYGLMFSGPANDVILRGNRCIQPLNTPRGDAKTGNQNDFPDHAAVRVPRFIRMGISQNDLRTFSGWSSGGGDDKAGQQNLRLYYNDNEVGTKGCVIGNRTCGRNMVAWGRATDNTQTMTNPAQLLIAANQHRHHAQGTNFITATGGGLFVYSNTVYRPALATEMSDNQEFSMVRFSSTSGTASVTQTVLDEPSYFGFNTMVTDMTSAQDQWNLGGADEATHVIIDTPAGVTDVTQGSVQIAGDGMSNSGSLIAGSAFSRPNLRPITSGDADTTVSSGARPPVDVAFTSRSGATGAGAWHTAAADTTPADAANSVAPTIGALTGWSSPAVYGVTDIGTWTGLDDWSGSEYRWLLNGSEITGAHLTTVFDDAFSGNLQCQFTVVGPSGVRVTANSNTIAI